MTHTNIVENSILLFKENKIFFFIFNHDWNSSNGRSNPEVVGSIPTVVITIFLYLVWFPDTLYKG